MCTVTSTTWSDTVLTKNKYYSYEKYADIIDAILKEIISQGKGIELNTAGF